MNSFSKSNSELLTESLKHLISEYHKKREELEKLRPEIINIKTEFNTQIKIYQDITKKIITCEKEIEKNFNQIAKIKTNQEISILNNLNRKCFLHLLEYSKNNNQNIKELFNVLNFKNKESEFLVILKNENEFNYLLHYSYSIYKNLYQNDKKRFEEIKNFFDNLNVYTYPFDFIFEYLKNNVLILNLNNEIAIKQKNLELEIQNKNIKFLEIKSIENDIIKQENYYKSLIKYRKVIHAIVEQYKEIKTENIEETNKYLNKVEQIKNFDFNGKNINLDNMSSLSLQSEYTVSENVSLISNSLNISNLLANNTNSNTTIISKPIDSNSQKPIKDKKEPEKKVYFKKISNYDINKTKNSKSVMKKEKKIREDEDESLQIILTNRNDELLQATMLIKDSICDEMITNNFKRNNILKNNNNNILINNLGLYNINNTESKINSNITNTPNLKFEGEFEASSCCTACT
jgi:hypothetical protein